MPTQRANGRYYVQRTFPGVGKVYRSLRTDRKARAQCRERMLESLHQQGQGALIRAFNTGEVSIQELEEQFESGRTHELSAKLRRGTASLADAVEAALDWKDPDVRKGTLDRYRNGLDHFRRFVGDDDAPVADVLSDDRVQGFKQFRLGEGAAQQTINNDVGAVSILATYAMKKGWIDERPDIKRFEYQARIRWMDAGQLASYMAALRAAFRVQMQLLVGTGMRLGESEGLRVCDLRLGEDDSRAMIEDSKTEAGVRTVFVPHWAAEAIAEHVEDHGLAGTDRLFTIDRRTVQTEHKRACGLVGIHDHTIHDHRHTAAVHLARAGMPLHLLQQQLGHKHIEMTMKYSQFHPDYADVARYFDEVGDQLGLGGGARPQATPNNNANNTATEEGSVAADRKGP